MRKFPHSSACGNSYTPFLNLPLSQRDLNRTPIVGHELLQSNNRGAVHDYAGEGLFCVLRLLFCGSIGSIAITKVYLLAHLVVIAFLIHVAKLFPDVIHHSLHRRMFLNV